MRNILLIAVAAALAGTPGTAPAAAENPTWELVFYGGGVTASFTGSEAKDFVGDEYNEGFTGGLGLILRADEEIAVETGIRYVRKGGAGTFLRSFAIPNFTNVISEVGTGEFTLDYVEVPLLVAGVLDVGARSHVRGFAGIALGILVDTGLEGTIDDEPLDVELDGVFSDIDFSGVVGAAYRYAFESFALHIDGRWSRSLVSIENDDTVDPKITNNVWALSLGVGLPLAYGE